MPFRCIVLGETAGYAPWLHAYVILSKRWVVVGTNLTVLPCAAHPPLPSLPGVGAKEMNAGDHPVIGMADILNNTGGWRGGEQWAVQSDAVKPLGPFSTRPAQADPACRR